MSNPLLAEDELADEVRVRPYRAGVLDSSNVTFTLSIIRSKRVLRLVLGRFDRYAMLEDMLPSTARVKGRTS